MAWIYAVVFVVAFVAAYAMAPKPQNQPSPGVGEVKAPTAEVGREIPVLFGTRDLKAPNVVWYGHLKTVAVKKKGGEKWVR